MESNVEKKSGGEIANTVGSVFLVLAGGFTVYLAHLALTSLTFMCLWNWFVSGSLGFREFGFLGAVGVTLAAFVLTHQFDMKSFVHLPDQEKGWVVTAAGYWLLIRPLLFLAAGWIVYRIAF